MEQEGKASSLKKKKQKTYKETLQKVTSNVCTGTGQPLHSNEKKVGSR